MSRTKTFDISSNPIPDNLKDKKINDWKRKVIDKFNSCYREDELNHLFRHIECSSKSSRTLLENDKDSHAWENELYCRIYEMIHKSHKTTIGLILKIGKEKFMNESIPINYITSIIRTGIDKQSRIDSVIDKDLSRIRERFMKLNGDVNLIATVIPPEFLELKLKVNRNSSLDQETKGSLIKRINESQKKIQEWIKEKKRG